MIRSIAQIAITTSFCRAIKALKLPRGGVSYIAHLFECSRDTIVRGIKELGEAETLTGNSSRQPGGGRKPLLKKRPAINDVFLQLLKVLMQHWQCTMPTS